MTIYLNFYIIIYLVTLVKLNYLLVNFGFLQDSNNSIPYLLSYILKFNKFSGVIFILFLSLAGLPPFIFFFIKFNYLINLLYKLNFFVIFLVFIIFFLNMLFYIQIFFHKNVSITHKIVKPSRRHYVSLDNLFNITWFSLFIFFSIFFFADLVFILKLFIIGNI